MAALFKRFALAHVLKGTLRRFEPATRLYSGFENVDGDKIYFEKVGTGDHKLLLMPGALGSVATDFQMQMKHIDKDRFTIYAWDPPGYGKSIPPERTWPLDFFRRDADCAAALLKAQGEGSRFSLLGWSDGAITALVLAVFHPQLVNKLVLWGGNAYFDDEDIRLFEALRDLDKWSTRMREPMEQVYGKEYFRKHWNEWIDAAAAIVTKNGGEIIAKRIGEIEHPTLVIHGAKDALVKEEHPDFIHENIRGAKRVDLPEGKHNLHIRHHEWFHEVVTEFLLSGTVPSDEPVVDLPKN